MLTSIGEGTQNKDNSVRLLNSPLNWLVFATFGIGVVLWVIVQISGTTDAKTNYYFSLVLGLVPFIASMKGIRAAKAWGGMSSVLGRSIGALSLGLLLWGSGELVWSYYNLVLLEAAPYPSLADVFFVPGFVFWILSSIFLVRLAGVNLILKKRPALWWLVLVLLAVGVAGSYYLLVTLARGGVVLTDTASPLKVVLDIFYPLADFLSLSIVIVILSIAGKYIGGKLRLPIFLMILGMAIMYVGDIMFGYATTKETFYNANLGDLVLLLGVSALSLSLSLSVITYSQTVPVIKPRGSDTDGAA